MAIQLRCCCCGAIYLVDDKFAGQKADCPHCGTVIPIARPPERPVTAEIVPEVANRLPKPLEISKKPLPFKTVNVSPSNTVTIQQRQTTAMQEGGKQSQGQDTTNLILGIIGSLLLSVGVFAPFLRLPFLGGIDYFRNGQGDGVIVLLLGLVSLLLVLRRTYVGLWFTAGGSLVVIGLSYLSFQQRLREVKGDMTKDLADNPFAPLGEAMVESVSIDWGFLVLVIGAGLLIAAAAVPVKKNSNP